MVQRKSLFALVRDESGAVAATYALALVGLVAAGGVGFDFARLATMSSELHNAADQAALAAATQLDGTSSAITNATSAANTLVGNQTLLANDGAAKAATVATLKFYETRTEADKINGTTTSDPTRAHFVRIIMTARKAFYALTPIANAVSSGDISAMATAGLGSAVCKVPPVMLCNPGVDPATFTASSLIGKGIVLKGTGGGGAWAPGDFGFLDVGSGASDLGKLMGWVNPPNDCVDVANPSTEPGAVTSVINDFNTRFDIYDGGDNINCYSGSLCPPSDNARKDVVQKGNLTTSSTLVKKDCGIQTGVGSDGWQITDDPYRPTSNNACSSTYKCSSGTWPDAMGYPRDITHAYRDPIAAGDSRIGDGVWDINTYWQVNYGAAYSSQVNGKSAPTRYEVYKWERSNGTGYRQFNNGGNKTDFKAPICRSGYAPGGTKVDRRVLPVAVVNCTGLSGKAAVTPLDWVDVFLVEPSLDRKMTTGTGKNKVTTTYTNKGDIYVEVIGKSGQGDEGAQAQFVRRDKPYLVN